MCLSRWYIGGVSVSYVLIFMSATSENNKRIAKNTLFLYMRMLLIMGVTLYTSRVVLQVLGVEDFGIYNVVGGIVVLFTFVNNAMVTSTQRFLNYELGHGDSEAVRRVFSASVTIHLGIALLTFVLAETVGLWFLEHYIQYPSDREWAVTLTYQFTILSTCINVVRTPYNAAIIAHERMSFYAYSSVIEAVLRLLIVYLLALASWDRLIFYAFLMFVVLVLITVCYYLYCRRSFAVCLYRFFWDKGLYRSLLGFSGWSLFGGVANLGASQGLSILLTLFFGVTVNAAMGIANQVQSAVYSFVGNFQTAFNPQIVKSYASGDRGYFIDLIMRTSKYSYYLLYVISLPLYLCCEEVLALWLGEVPTYTVSFCRWMILFSLLDAIQGPLWISVQATGNIRNYQILMGIMILSNVPISYLFFRLGYVPEVALGIKVVMNVLIYIVRLLYLKYLFSFPTNSYLRKVVFRSIIVTAISYELVCFSSLNISFPIIKIVSSIISSLLSVGVLFYFIGLDRSERRMVALTLERLKK